MKWSVRQKHLTFRADAASRLVVFAGDVSHAQTPIGEVDSREEVGQANITPVLVGECLCVRVCGAYVHRREDMSRNY